MEKYMRTKNRYRSRNSGASSWVTVLLIVLVFAAGFFVSKLTIGGGLKTDNMQSYIQSQVRSEAKYAVNYINRLTRNNGTSSDYYTIANVKEYIHGMELLNELYVVSYGETNRIFTAEELENAKTCADEFIEKLNSGSRVTEALTALSDAVSVLYNKAMLILGE